jgi:DNA-binding MarR family transcriptional regulator
MSEAGCVPHGEVHGEHEVHGEIGELAGTLRVSVGKLVRRLKQAGPDDDLTIAESSALSRLDRGGPATAAELARAEQISPQAIGITLGVLEQRGFLARRADPRDARRAILSLTPAGQDEVRHKRDAGARRIAEILHARFTTEELQALAAAAPLIRLLGESV